MTPEETAQLRELGEELSGAAHSPWEPRAVAEAFRRDDEEVFVLTMQAWIDLDAARSPILQGDLPEPDGAVLEHYAAAFAAFGYTAATPGACEAEELILLGQKMIAAVREGFSMALRMTPPGGAGTSPDRGGFGTWLPLLACLKTQLGFSLTEAMSVPVKQAFALIAAHRANEGWTVAGEPYQYREVQS